MIVVFSQLPSYLVQKRYKKSNYFAYHVNFIEEFLNGSGDLFYNLHISDNWSSVRTAIIVPSCKTFGNTSGVPQVVVRMPVGHVFRSVRVADAPWGWGTT